MSIFFIHSSDNNADGMRKITTPIETVVLDCFRLTAIAKTLSIFCHYEEA